MMYPKKFGIENKMNRLWVSGRLMLLAKCQLIGRIRRGALKLALLSLTFEHLIPECRKAIIPYAILYGKFVYTL